jgi:hypothetical protein
VAAESRRQLERWWRWERRRQLEWRRWWERQRERWRWRERRQRWNGGGGGNGGGSWNGGGWHGGGAWNGGSWHQGWYGSRYGWWWVVPGFGWYGYDAPVYPYPDPDAYTQVMSAIPYWYYCQDPAGYYPYVTQCSGPWQPVPAQPSPAPAYPLAPGYSPQPSYAPQAGGPGNSTASDLNRQELNRLGAAPVNPL